MLKNSKWMEKGRVRVWFRDRVWDLAWLLPRVIIEGAIVRALYETAQDPGDITISVQQLLDRWRPGRKDVEWECLGRAMSAKLQVPEWTPAPVRCAVCGSYRDWCRKCGDYACANAGCEAYRLTSEMVRCPHEFNYATEPGSA